MKYWLIDPEKKLVTEYTYKTIRWSYEISDALCLDFMNLYQTPIAGGLLYHGAEPRSLAEFYILDTLFVGLSMFASERPRPTITWGRSS